jgi:hypothetical protein
VIGTNDRTAHHRPIPSTIPTLLCTILLSLLLAAGVHASMDLKGNDFLQSSSREQQAYASGILDGFQMAPFFSPLPPTGRHFNECVLRMTSHEVSAMLENQLRDRPETWHRPAYDAMYAAFVKACGWRP